MFIVWTSSRETVWPCHRTGSRSSSVPASATGVTTARTDMSVQQPAVVCRRHRNIAALSPVLRGEIAAVPSPFCVFHSLWVRSRYSIPDAEPSLRVHEQFRPVPTTTRVCVCDSPDLRRRRGSSHRSCLARRIYVPNADSGYVLRYEF